MALVVRSRAPSEVKSRVSTAGREVPAAGGELGPATTAGLSAAAAGVATAAGEADAAGFVVAAGGFDGGTATISGVGGTDGPLVASSEAGDGGAVSCTLATVASGRRGEDAGMRAGAGVSSATAAAGASVGCGLCTAQPAAAREQNTITTLNAMTLPTLDLCARWPNAAISVAGTITSCTCRGAEQASGRRSPYVGSRERLGPSAFSVVRRMRREEPSRLPGREMPFTQSTSSWNRCSGTAFK